MSPSHSELLRVRVGLGLIPRIGGRGGQLRALHRDEASRKWKERKEEEEREE